MLHWSVPSDQPSPWKDARITEPDIQRERKSSKTLREEGKSCLSGLRINELTTFHWGTFGRDSEDTSVGLKHKEILPGKCRSRAASLLQRALIHEVQGMSCQATSRPGSGCCSSLCINLHFKNKEENKMLLLIRRDGLKEWNICQKNDLCLCALREKTSVCSFVASKDP